MENTLGYEPGDVSSILAGGAKIMLTTTEIFSIII